MMYPGCAKKSNTEVIQRFKNKIIWKIVNAPWCIRSNYIYRGLEEVKSAAAINHEKRLEVIQSLDNQRW